MKKVEISPRGVFVHELQILAGQEGEQRLRAQIPRVVLWPRWSKLVIGTISLNRALIERPEIQFFDGPNKSAKKSETRTESTQADPSERLSRIQIVGGSFKYIRDVKGTHAELYVHKINARLEIESAVVHGFASAQFGKSGSFDLWVTTSYSKPLEIDVELKARDQNLEDLSRFFEPNAGVKLEGLLLSGHATAKLRDRHVSATLQADYKDFKLRVNPMYDRNEIQAFFTNLGVAIAVRKKNVDKSKSEKTEAVEIDREKDESIVSFILRGWRDAALKLAI